MRNLAPASSFLPFLASDPIAVGDCWSVDASGDYWSDFDRGMEYAVEWLRFIGGPDKLQLPGGLMQIVSSMAKAGALDRGIAGDSNDPIAFGFLAFCDLYMGEAVRTLDPVEVLAHHRAATARDVA